MKKKRTILLCLVALVLVLGRWAVYYIGAVPLGHMPLNPGNVEVPSERSINWNDRSAQSDYILEHWAEQRLGNWNSNGKVGEPRALMGRFMLKRDLDAANDYLLSLTPWGRAGSTWARHKEGDYDFTMAALMPILFVFGDDPDVLYPQTRDHVLNVLLPLEGGDPLVKVPRTLGLVRDTENHLLMTEGSRYLKNRWLMLHGSALSTHDNVANGLEEWLLKLIEELRTAGLYEFNSIPYEGYTLTALLNLETFGSKALQTAVRGLLDQLNWKYAMGSLKYRRFPPFRRRYSHAADTALNGDRQVALIKTWMSFLPGAPADLTLNGSHIGLWACWSSYRLPDETARWILEKPKDYLVRMGHGPGGSPEVYSGGPGWLLTAGGVNRGKRSLIVARPITLMLDDGATDLSQVLHLAGPGSDFREWNNTGVWKKFAVTAGAVHIPDEWKVDAAGELWSVYGRGRFCVAVHSRTDLGVVHLVRSADPLAVLEAVEKSNADGDVLMTAFQEPGGSRIEYDIAAPKSRWVIKAINGNPVNRNFDHWPILYSYP